MVFLYGAICKWSIVICLAIQCLGPFMLLASSIINLPIDFFFAKELPIDQGVSMAVGGCGSVGPAQGRCPYGIYVGAQRIT
jgi:hypothetical protein